MTLLVADASAVAAALVGDDEEAGWCRSRLEEASLMAPDHLLVEVANALRGMSSRGKVSTATVEVGHADLLALNVETVPYPRTAYRAWALRHTVTPYDACYVALAEELGVPLLTLDRRLARGSGPRCEFLTPPD